MQKKVMMHTMIKLDKRFLIKLNKGTLVKTSSFVSEIIRFLLLLQNFRRHTHWVKSLLNNFFLKALEIIGFWINDGADSVSHYRNVI